MKIKHVLSGAVILMAASQSMAQSVSVEITNLTSGMYFTPLLVTAHDSDIKLFEVGSSASDALQAMAEGGDISGLASAASTAGAMSAENPAGGLLAPAMSTTTMSIDATDNPYLSITAMMLPTNDGFVGLDSWMIPTTPGTYTVMLNAYDAGTEANNELVIGMAGGASGVLGIPASPGDNGGTGGTGVTTTETNSSVHIHPGNIGDSDAAGGASDASNTVHRWLNPVAKAVITVQ